MNNETLYDELKSLIGILEHQLERVDQDSMKEDDAHNLLVDVQTLRKSLDRRKESRRGAYNRREVA